MQIKKEEVLSILISRTEAHDLVSILKRLGKLDPVTLSRVITNDQELEAINFLIECLQSN